MTSERYSRNSYELSRSIFVSSHTLHIFAWLVAHLKSSLTCFMRTPGRLAAFTSGASCIHFHPPYTEMVHKFAVRACCIHSPHQSWFSFQLFVLGFLNACPVFSAFCCKRHAYCHTCIDIKTAEPWLPIATTPAYVSFPSPPHHISRTRAFCS